MSKIEITPVGQEKKGITAFKMSVSGPFEPAFQASNNIVLSYDEFSAWEEDMGVLLVNETEGFSLCSTKDFKLIVEAVEEFNSRPNYSSIYFFFYRGGSHDGYRRVGVTSEDSNYIIGVDLDIDAPRKYLRSKIDGKVYRVEVAGP